MVPRTAAEKMGVRAGARAYFHRAPRALVASMGLPDLVVSRSLSGAFEYLHLFARSQRELRKAFVALAGHLTPAGAMWVSWPKARGSGSDLTLRDVIRIGYDGGLVESKTIALDEFWSAMKFTHPKPGKRYGNSYGTLRPREPTAP